MAALATVQQIIDGVSVEMRSPQAPNSAEKARSVAAIDDRIYEKVARCLAGEEVAPKLKEDKQVFHYLRENWKRLSAEQRTESSGEVRWVIIEKKRGRIVARKSEVESLIEKYYFEHNHPAQRELIVRLQKDYAGVGPTKIADFLRRQQKHEHRKREVRFPNPPMLKADRAMQYVQIDVVEMPVADYGSKTYDHMLMVQCLHSRFYFARALSNVDAALVTRHLIDIFGIFGPPEAYQCYTDRGVVEESMPGVAQHFGIPVQAYGRKGITVKGGSHHYTLRKLCLDKSSELYQDERFWVEVMPQVLIEWNQYPPRSSSRQSPFKIMFGRQPWAGPELPPWIKGTASQDEATQASALLNGSQNSHDSFNASMQTSQQGEQQPSSTQMVVNTPGGVQIMVGHHPVMPPTPKRDLRQLNESGLPVTGILYQAGDEVYIRNPDFKGHASFRAPKCPRFWEGVIIAVDLTRDQPYHVQYRLLNDQGAPDQDVQGWVSIFDVTARTGDLEWVRRVSSVEETAQLKLKPPELCQCDDQVCRLLKGEKCTYSMNKKCCRERNTDCQVHHKPPERRSWRNRPKPKHVCKCDDIDCRKWRNRTCPFQMHKECCVEANHDTCPVHGMSRMARRAMEQQIIATTPGGGRVNVRILRSNAHLTGEEEEEGDIEAGVEEYYEDESIDFSVEGDQELSDPQVASASGGSLDGNSPGLPCNVPASPQINRWRVSQPVSTPSPVRLRGESLPKKAKLEQTGDDAALDAVISVVDELAPAQTSSSTSSPTSGHASSSHATASSNVVLEEPQPSHSSAPIAQSATSESTEEGMEITVDDDPPSSLLAPPQQAAAILDAAGDADTSQLSPPPSRSQLPLDKQPIPVQSLVELSKPQIIVQRQQQPPQTQTVAHSEVQESGEIDDQSQSSSKS